ncbi:MAG: Fur family transcriptional regulator [Sporichthyaceae bacterium]
MTPTRCTREKSGAIATRSSRHRAALLARLRQSASFCSAQELHDQLAAELPRAMSLSTVYRTLHHFERAELVDVIHDLDGERRYRLRSGHEHRHYLMCLRCHRSIAVDSEPVERWADRVARAAGYSDVTHVVELRGYCNDCPALSG